VSEPTPIAVAGPGFGPWAPGIADAERQARWRAFAALALVFVGNAHPLPRACAAAETIPTDDTAAAAWRAVAALPALTRRRLLATYWAVEHLVPAASRR
jgi:hypothetical protein